MNKIWEMNVMSGKNPSHTAQFYNSYDNREFSASQVLAREGGQNTSDAGRYVDGLTEMRLRWLSVQGENKAQLLDHLQLEYPLLDRIEAYDETERHPKFCDAVRDLFSSDDLQLLLIQDFNTCGLGGKWNRYEQGDHFARLVCALNLDDKSDGDPGSGGSFGLGKTTYSNSSKVQTVLYHSVFPETSETEGANRRLMTAGVYPSHTWNDQKYGGFAYFGLDSATHPGEAKPFENENASGFWDKVCELCGRDDLKRDENQTGTDILILMPTVDCSSVKTAIEDYYWPAIVERSLSVTLFDADGEEYHPAPVARVDLKSFINLYRRIRNNENIHTENLVVEKLRKRNQRKTGTVAFEAVELGGDKDHLTNRVALMRGTGMVINYAKLGADRFEPAMGVFVADADVYPYLNASENMAHSEWDVNSRRLARVHGDEGIEIVKYINNSVASRFQEFQKNLQPDTSTTRNEHGFFAQLMSKALRGNKGDPRPDPGPEIPASISLIRKSRIENLSTWSLKISDNEHTPNEEFLLKVKPSISIAGDAKRVALKRREIVIKDKSGVVLTKDERPELAINFQKGSVYEALLELDAPGERNYVVSCRCTAEIEINNDNSGDGPTADSPGADQ